MNPVASAISVTAMISMRRLFTAALVTALIIGAACRRVAPAGDARERAYQANNRGVAMLEQFKYPEAAAAFRDALNIDSSLAAARLNLGLGLFYALDLPGAAREAGEAARLLPSAPQPHYLLGLIARAENRTADAEREFARVRQIDADDVGASVNLGQIHLEERRYPEAIEILRRAAAAEPYNVTATYNLGLALTRGGQPDEGRQVLERAQTLRGTGYAVTYGTGYLEQGRYAEAIASTGLEADLVDPSDPPTSFTLEIIGQRPAPPPQAESPFGRAFPTSELTPVIERRIAEGLGGAVTLADIDGDGDLDVFEASPSGQRLIRNDGAAWTDVTSASGLGSGPSSVVPVACVAGDYDNDGRVDLFVAGYGGSLLYHNDGGGRFTDVTAAAGFPPYPFLPGAVALADVDHDGDLDVVVAGLADFAATRQRPASQPLTFPREFAPAPIRLLRNNGNGTFADITRIARLDATARAIAIVPTDFDNRRDIDLLIVDHDAPPLLFQNLRDGTFRNVAADVGLTAVGAAGVTAGVTAGDVNKDDYPDLFFARGGASVFALSDGRGRFTVAPAPDGAAADRAAQFVDYDNDGLLDLIAWTTGGLRLFRNLGPRWADVSRTAIAAAAAPAAALASARRVALADVNGDGSTDLMTAGADLTLWRSSGNSGAGRRSLRVQLKGRVSNRSGTGSKVQLRAGSLKARLETSATSPPVSPADLVFGLGSRSQADVVRVLWPSGILQAEAVSPAGSSTGTPLAIEELDRKPSSCPFLFTWNGERFEFVTDFMGGGEMGYWEGPGKRNTPDPIEYVRIRGEQLQPRDGAFHIRVTNELEEALFVDRLELLAIAHPNGLEMYPNEGMTEPPKPFKLFAVADERIPRAVDDHGHDVTERIRRIDRRYPDDFSLQPIRGYAETHGLTLDLDPPGRAPILLLTAWTDYAFSSDNVAATHAGLTLAPPSLQIRSAGGSWRTAVADIGIPVGRPQTIPIDLAPHLRPGEHDVRIVTNMRIYWDRIAIGRLVAPDRTITTRLDPRRAVLRERGFSAEVRPGGGEPVVYDYDRVSLSSPWKTMSGRYTRTGDVRELVAGADDMFVVAKPGDEIALDFDASLRPLPEGWTRTFLLRADGYSKEMDINSASPDTVEPLPFHAMRAYPYRPSEHYPDTPQHEQYRAVYNTRVVVRAAPSIDGVRANNR